jgi:hypothetical protein
MALSLNELCKLIPEWVDSCVSLIMPDNDLAFKKWDRSLGVRGELGNKAMLLGKNGEEEVTRHGKDCRGSNSICFLWLSV